MTTSDLQLLLTSELKQKLSVSQNTIDATLSGGSSCYLCRVGSEFPVQYLLLHPTDDGFVRCTLWGLGKKGCVIFADGTVPARNVSGLLTVWSTKYVKRD